MELQAFGGFEPRSRAADLLWSRQITGTAADVFRYLFERCGGFGEVTTTWQQLAAAVGRTDRSARRAMQKLEAAGLARRNQAASQPGRLVVDVLRPLRADPQRTLFDEEPPGGTEAPFTLSPQPDVDARSGEPQERSEPWTHEPDRRRQPPAATAGGNRRRQPPAAVDEPEVDVAPWLATPSTGPPPATARRLPHGTHRRKETLSHNPYPIPIEQPEGDFTGCAGEPTPVGEAIAGAMANIAARDPVDVGLRRARWIADLAARLNDPDTSTAVLRQIVEAVENGQLDWNETVEYALDKVREKRAAGELQKSPGAYFVGLLRRRGLSLKPKGATRRPA